METNDGKAEKFFKDFGKKVDQFILEAKDAGSRLEVDLQKKYDELKVTAEKLKSEVENKERWKEVEVSLKKASDELSNAFKAAFKKKEETK
jgi:phosphoglycerate-specific signal transduction histidine kinase